MSKKNKKLKQVTYHRGDGSVIAIITDHYKKGKLRAGSKKEKKILKGACTHHFLSKNDRVKPAYYNDGRGYCTCNICGHTWPAKMKPKDKVESAIGPVRELNDQLKTLAQAMNADKKTIGYVSEFGSMIELFPPFYERIKTVAEKNDRVKKKKKNKGSSDGGVSFGAWK